MNKKPFDDLKAAILAVLNEAKLDKQYYTYYVNGYLLHNLQEEYNIHFVEPNQPQVKVV